MRASAVTMRLTAIAAMAVLASGCGTTRSEVVLTCPKLPVYTDAQMQRAADEYDRLDSAGIIRLMIDDYGEVRARCRAVGRKA